MTDFDRFIRVSGQGGETEAPTQGVQEIAFMGQIVAIVVAESYEVARDAALQLHVEYERATAPSISPPIAMRPIPRPTPSRPGISRRATSTRPWPRRR